MEEEMITVLIDEITPCLKDSITGELINTECIPVKRNSVLKKFNTRTGWHVNWYELSKSNDIYALVLEGTVDIQGLVAVRPSQ